jgi:hypothetical protein
MNIIAMQKSAYISIPKTGKTGCKVNMADIKVSKANAQSRPGGILIAHAIGKLCFALLTPFSAAQNNLPLKRGRMRSEVVHPTVNIRQLKSRRTFLKS